MNLYIRIASALCVYGSTPYTWLINNDEINLDPWAMLKNRDMTDDTQIRNSTSSFYFLMVAICIGGVAITIMYHFMQLASGKRKQKEEGKAGISSKALLVFFLFAVGVIVSVFYQLSDIF